MRKIEKQMIEAIEARKSFSSGNTCVIQDEHNNAIVTLHGNVIAKIDYTTSLLFLYDGGWQSNTTKSRLNALLSMSSQSYRVFQEKWEWYVRVEKETYSYVEPFVNGYVATL